MVVKKMWLHRALGGGRLPLPVPMPAKHRGHRRPGVGGLPGGEAEGLCLCGGAAGGLPEAVRRPEGIHVPRTPGAMAWDGGCSCWRRTQPASWGPRPCTSPPTRRWRARPSTRPWAAWRPRSTSPPMWSRSPATASWSARCRRGREKAKSQQNRFFGVCRERRGTPFVPAQ